MFSPVAQKLYGTATNTVHKNCVCSRLWLPD